MKKIVLTFGIIAGLVCGGMFFLTFAGDSEELLSSGYGELIGYVTMIISLSSIFFAVKQYRDNHLDGTIKFGKAFLIGLYITLIASVIYVLAWELYSSSFASDFADKYMEQLKMEKAEQGMTEAEIEAEMASQFEMMELYKNNTAFRMAMTFTEIFPVGLVISLICALILGVILKDKNQNPISSSTSS